MESKLYQDWTLEKNVEFERLQALHAQALKTKELFWKKKLGIRYISDSNKNILFFHASVKANKKKHVTRLKLINDSEDWTYNKIAIHNKAIEHCSTQLTKEQIDPNSGVMRIIPKLVSTEDNAMLEAIPSMEEVKNIVFLMNDESAPGPEGITAFFYRFFWDLVKEDILVVAKEFFSGALLPKYFLKNHICMVPKKNIPTRFNDFRPISICNVSYKNFSKIITSRLSTILPRVISLEQRAFVKERLITKNIALSQELMQNISKKAY